MEKYLLENTKDAQEMRENLRQLLETGEGVNIKLAFTLIEGGGLHESLATYVFVSFLWHESEEIQQWAASIIANHLPAKVSQKWLLEEKPKKTQYYSYLQYIKEKTLCHDLEKIAKLKMVDKTVLGMATLKMSKKGGLFCLKHKIAPTNDILKEMLNDFKLDLNDFGLEELPAEVTHFVNLRELNICRNKFTELPKNFENLRNLEKITYTGTPLKPSEIKRLEKMMPDFFGHNHYEKGCNLKHQSKQPKKAIPHLKKATKLIPEYAENWHNLGACLLDTKQEEKALIPLQNALKCYDERLLEMPNAYDLFWKSCVFALLKDKENAFIFLKEAIDINPNYKDSAKTEEDYKAYFEDETFKSITN